MRLPKRFQESWCLSERALTRVCVCCSCLVVFFPGGLSSVRSTAPDTASKDSWGVYVSAAKTGVGLKEKSVLIATLVNTGNREQIAYTPGLVGPSFYHVHPRVSPMETHVTPRKDNERRHDFVRLWPGQGFSRTHTSNTPLDKVKDVAKVHAHYCVYQRGHEGVSRRVAKIIAADRPLIVRKPVAMPKTKPAKADK